MYLQTPTDEAVIAVIALEVKNKNSSLYRSFWVKFNVKKAKSMQ